MKAVIYVAIGGAIGSVLRYLLSKVDWLNATQWNTMAINLIGSFLVGLLFGYVTKNSSNNVLTYLLMIGFCGGFTTFSTFSLDNLKLLINQEYLTVLIYSLSSVVGGILMVYLGYILTAKL